MDFFLVALDWAEEASQLGHDKRMRIFGKWARAFRVLRMGRLLRIAKLGFFFNLFMEQVRTEQIRVSLSIFKFLVMMLATGHVLACVWYSVGAGSDRGWLAELDCRGDNSFLYCYTLSLRWSLAQFGGGMDEIIPITLAEHLFAVLAYLLAFWFGAVLVSMLTSLITQVFFDGSEANKQLRLLNKYLAQNGISKKLALRMTRNARHMLAEKAKNRIDEVAVVVRLVTEPLRVELYFEIYSKSLSAHPFFSRYMMACPYVTKRICHSALSMMQTAAGDIIFHAGEIPTQPRMFIVHKSAALSYTQTKREEGDHRAKSIHEVVEEGAWVSEALLWVSWTHQGMLACTEDSQVPSMNAREFQAIASHFEYSENFDPRIYARRFVVHLNAKLSEGLSDVMYSPEIRKLVSMKMRVATWALPGLMEQRRASPTSGAMFGYEGEQMSGDPTEEAADNPLTL